MISARYNVLQLVLDHGSPEPVTIGVVAYAEGNAELRLIGLRTDRAGFSRGMFRYALPDLAGVEWIYEQWIDRLQRLSARFSDRAEENIRLLRNLESRGESIIASVEGEVSIPDLESLPGIATSLFGELVMNRPAMRRAEFFGLVDNLISDSELRWFDGFTEDAEIELLNDDWMPRQLLYFPYLWDSKSLGRRFAAKLLWFGGIPQDVSASVADAAAAFEIVRQREFLGHGRCILIHSAPTEDQQRYLDIFRSSAATIAVDSPSAADELRLIFFGS